MKNEELFQMLNGMEDKYIEKASEMLALQQEAREGAIVHAAPKSRGSVWKKVTVSVAAAAAAITLFAGVAVTLSGNKTNDNDRINYYITEEGTVSLTTDARAESPEKVNYHSGYYIGDYDGVELPYKAPENISVPSYEEVTAKFPLETTSHFHRDEMHDDYDVGLTVLPSEFAQTYNVPLLFSDKFTEENWTNIMVDRFDGKLDMANIGYALIHNDSGRRLYIRAVCFFNENIGVSAGGVNPEYGLYKKIKLSEGTEGVISKQSKWDKRNCAAVFVHEGMIFWMMVDTEINTGIDDMEQMLDYLGIL